MGTKEVRSGLIKGLILVIELAVFIVVVFKLPNLSYDVLSVTPLFLFRAYDYLMPLAIMIVALLTAVATVLDSKFLLIVGSLILYYIILYVPYTLFSFPIYNDQLGFALEVYSGLARGKVSPYQGEWTTLGHAYFATIIGEVLNLNLFGTIQVVKLFWVFISFILFSALALKVYKSSEGSILNLWPLAIILFFPAFILEPLVYSRGYFGIVVSLYLFLAAFNLVERFNAKNTIVFLVLHLAMSISYPLQSLLVPIAMLLTPLSSKILSLIKVKPHTYEVPALIVASIAFFIWIIIQVFLGYASWKVLHEVIANALQMKFFTALESAISLSYVGDAAIYVKLRVVMMLAGWLLSFLLLIALIRSILGGRRVLELEVFALSLIIAVGAPAILYALFFHEPGLRFFRVMISMFPIVITYLHKERLNRIITITKVFQYFTILNIILFLVLSPIVKWGWTFVAYPTLHDIALADLTTSYYVDVSHNTIYAPGSHELLWFYFKLRNESLNIIFVGDVYGSARISVSKALQAYYVTTFYRVYIYSRWLGLGIDNVFRELKHLILENDLLYNDYSWTVMKTIRR
jgi:hypothetical protein